MAGGSGTRADRGWRGGLGRWCKAAAWLTLATFAFACSKRARLNRRRRAAAPAPTKCRGCSQECIPGQPCQGDTECVTVGDEHRCEHPCETDDDCSAFKIQQPVEKVSTVCGTVGPALKACREPCTRHYEGAYACVDGHPVSCAALDETSCTICGCPDNLRCEHNVGCGGKRGLDEECLEDGDCNSNNCDFYAHVCRVPVGTACTASSQGIARKKGTFCSRSCGSIFDCDGGACLFQECRPPCTGEFDPSCRASVAWASTPAAGSPTSMAACATPWSAKRSCPHLSGAVAES